ncbi:cholecystokinin receptor type A, partial [Biomphalaria glabrata]
MNNSNVTSETTQLMFSLTTSIEEDRRMSTTVLYPQSQSGLQAEITTLFSDAASNSSGTLGSLVSFNDSSLLYNMSLSDLQEVINATNLTRKGAMFQEGIKLEHQIPLYVIIFLLSVVGNILVILTVAQNKKMRSVTNVFLLNLAVSDLLLAVFCMPFTLVPLLLRNFIFGEFMCVAIRYLQ